MKRSLIFLMFFLASSVVLADDLSYDSNSLSFAHRDFGVKFGAVVNGAEQSINSVTDYSISHVGDDVKFGVLINLRNTSAHKFVVNNLDYLYLRVSITGYDRDGLVFTKRDVESCRSDDAFFKTVSCSRKVLDLSDLRDKLPSGLNYDVSKVSEVNDTVVYELRISGVPKKYIINQLEANGNWTFDLDPTITSQAFSSSTTAGWFDNTQVVGSTIVLINASKNGSFATIVDCWNGSVDTYACLNANYWLNASWNYTNATINITASYTNVSTEGNLTGLVGWWNLSQNSTANGGIKDSSVFGNNGTSYNATYQNGSACYPRGDGCYPFADNRSFMLVNNSASLTLKQNTSFSVSAWTNLNILGDYFLVNKQENVLNEFVFSLRILPTGAMSFTVAKQNVGGVTASSPTSLVQANKWYHIVGVYNVTNVSLYVNGVLVGIAGISFSSATDGVALLHFGEFYNGGYRLNGSLDEVKIWNRSLSEDEVRQQYFRGTNFSNPDLVSNNTLSVLTGTQNARYALLNFTFTPVGGVTPVLYSSTIGSSNASAVTAYVAPSIILYEPVNQTSYSGSFNVNFTVFGSQPMNSTIYINGVANQTNVSLSNNSAVFKSYSILQNGQFVINVSVTDGTNTAWSDNVYVNMSFSGAVSKSRISYGTLIGEWVYSVIQFLKVQTRNLLIEDGSGNNISITNNAGVLAIDSNVSLKSLNVSGNLTVGGLSPNLSVFTDSNNKLVSHQLTLIDVLDVVSQPSNVTIVVGSSSDSLSNITSCNDGKVMVVSESEGLTPGQNISVTFSNVTSFRTAYILGYHSSVTSDYMTLSYKNCVSGDFDIKNSMADGSSYTEYQMRVMNQSKYNCGGNVTLQILHPDVGNGADKTYLDCVQLLG